MVATTSAVILAVRETAPGVLLRMRMSDGNTVTFKSVVSAYGVSAHVELHEILFLFKFTVQC